MNNIHIWLKGTNKTLPFNSYIGTLNVIKHYEKILRKNYDIHTYQISFCSTEYLVKGYKIFIHFNDTKQVEIQLGENICTQRLIKPEHNLEKLLLAGEFGKLYNREDV